MTTTPPPELIPPPATSTLDPAALAAAIARVRDLSEALQAIAVDHLVLRPTTSDHVRALREHLEGMPHVEDGPCDRCGALILLTAVEESLT